MSIYGSVIDRTEKVLPVGVEGPENYNAIFTSARNSYALAIGRVRYPEGDGSISTLMGRLSILKVDRIRYDYKAKAAGHLFGQKLNGFVSVEEINDGLYIAVYREYEQARLIIPTFHKGLFPHIILPKPIAERLADVYAKSPELLYKELENLFETTGESKDNYTSFRVAELPEQLRGLRVI